LAVYIVHACHAKKGGNLRDARPYIRSLESANCVTPGIKDNQGIYPTPWQYSFLAWHAKEADSEGRQGKHPTPWQCTLSHAWHAKEAETQGTPGRTSDPLAVLIVPHLPRSSCGAPRDARVKYISDPMGV